MRGGNGRWDGEHFCMLAADVVIAMCSVSGQTLCEKKLLLGRKSTL